MWLSILRIVNSDAKVKYPNHTAMHTNIYRCTQQLKKFTNYHGLVGSAVEIMSATGQPCHKVVMSTKKLRRKGF